MSNAWTGAASAWKLCLALAVGLFSLWVLQPAAAQSTTPWEVHPENDSSEFHAPEPGDGGSGVLKIGKEQNDIHGNEDGFTNSTGMKVVDCGRGNQCEIKFDLSATSAPPDGEKLLISFRDSHGDVIKITEAKTAGGTSVRSPDGEQVVYPSQHENPLTVKLPQCGEITVEVSVSEGNQPALQSSWKVRLRSPECH